jgi:phosphomannomutase
VPERITPAEWLAEDPDPGTRAELAALLAAAEDPGARGDAARADLAGRFSGPLAFGTAGLRGELGAGPARMNRAVVIRAAAGLAAYLKAEGAGPDASVVIGYDARHKSHDFAVATAAVVAGAGLRALLLPEPLPTPVLAFAVRRLGAAAGVMVTASHNPPRDNGYKVYLGDGSQIVPPADAAIAARIADVGPLSGVPLASGDGWEVLGPEVVAAYVARAAGVVAAGSPRELRVVHTSLHGVGRAVLHAAFARAGFAPPVDVPEQADPDPEFPTVPFPNPEEPGALDLALRTARATPGTDLVIANDPDADRCASAVPDPAAPGGWRLLTGDELGALLAAHLVGHRGLRDGVLAASVVSGSLIERVAASAGLDFARTLTGFKWISRVPGLRFGYEEAIGYCADPDAVRDKDGVTAALLVAELAATLKAAGRTPLDLLDDLALRHGLHATSQLPIRVADPALIRQAMSRLRAHPPAALAGLPVTGADDLASPAPGSGLPPTDALVLHLTDPAGPSARLTARPSGTEPKLKLYAELILPPPDRAALPAARARAAELLTALTSAFAKAAGLD